MAIFSVLKSASMYQGWSDADLHKLASISQIREFNSQDTVFDEGDSAACLYLVVNGTINIRKTTSAGDDEGVAVIGPGSHFGDMGMLSPTSGTEKRFSTAICAENTSVIEIPYVAFHQLLKESPAAGLCFYRNLATHLAGRIRRTTEDLTGIKALRLRHG